MNYEDMTLEELQALKAEKMKQELIAEFKAEEAKKKVQEQEEFKQQVIEEYKNSMKLNEQPITQTLETQRDEKSNENVNFLKFFTGNKPLKTYESFDYGWDGTDPPNEDCPADADDWSPGNVYVNAVWHAMYCQADLFKVCVKGLDVNAGDGHTVRIRLMSTFSAPEEIAACSCLSCTSTSVGYQPITITQHGQMTQLCEFDIFEVGERYRKEYLWAFGKTWADYFNGLIWDQLEAPILGSTFFQAAIHSQSIASYETLCTPSMASDECCEDEALLDIYNALDSLLTDMRVAHYNPDYIILHPTISQLFRRMQVPTPIFYNGVVIGSNGKLISFMDVPVIEYCGANSCTKIASEGAGTVVAIVVDSSRAVGAAFGKRPWMEDERVKQCNVHQYFMWSYFGTSALDLGAIGHVVVET